MTIERITEIRNAVKVLSTLTDSEWEKLSTVIKEKQKVVEALTPIQAEAQTVNTTQKTLFERVTNLIKQISIPANIKGYAYLREAIIYYMESEKPTKISMTKELYPTIAKKFQTTSTRVERAIRHAVEIAIDRGETKEIEKIFGDVEKYHKGKPSNSEVIATIAEYLKLNMD